ncbi:hypothetical protein SEPCBS119000_001455 [Sporothrix epigloea]|uniref:GDS1 winged helix domain-containing protein n=1 Tax=Sporothrix epigloea TaxID=1892477 RepID=A0ABP0DAR1_9PEZI
MPYNTRRKSLSLSSLGIHVPVTHAARDAARAAAANAITATKGSASSTDSASPDVAGSTAEQRQLTPPSDSTTSMAPPSFASPKRASSAADGPSSFQHSAKRTKRSHSNSEPISTALVTAVSKSSAAANSTAVATPPQSPKRQVSVEMDDVDEVEIDMEEINDDIVEAVIQQLKSTGNRPHLNKEFSAILMHKLKSVQHIATPPLSSATSASEATEEERRRELSPSPEVDLSSPEFDDLDDDFSIPGSPAASLPYRCPRYSRFSRHHYQHHHRASASYSSRSYRGGSPPLEKDEKEFTLTAEGLQKQKHAGKGSLISSAMIAAQAAPPSNSMYLDDANRDESLLFDSDTRQIDHFALMTSPVIRPMLPLGPKRDAEAENWAKLDSMVAGWDHCPESIELDELDCLLNEF